MAETLTHMDAPKGGCIKRTKGTYVQVFNADGKVIKSEFVAGDDCEYTDENDNALNHNDKRTNFYAPFYTGRRR